MKQGEISTKASRFGRTRGVIGIVFNNLYGRWNRNIVAVLAISLPSALLILFMFVSIRLDGVLYTSWLGEYVAMEVSTPHYIAVGLSLMISILTAGQMVWQNVVERTNEIALFKALGWKNRHIQIMVIIEGAILGFLSGVMALIFGVIIVSIVYNGFSFDQLLFYSSILIITVFVGIISALIPSLKVLQIEVVNGLKQM
jgi:ABC-type antimicrobial peptide transport system permease subunit